MQSVYVYHDFEVFFTNDLSNSFSVYFYINKRKILKYRCKTKEEAINFINLNKKRNSQL